MKTMQPHSQIKVGYLLLTKVKRLMFSVILVTPWSVISNPVCQDDLGTLISTWLPVKSLRAREDHGKNEHFCTTFQHTNIMRPMSNNVQITAMAITTSDEVQELDLIHESVF